MFFTISDEAKITSLSKDRYYFHNVYAMKDKRLRKLIQLCLHYCKIESHKKHWDDERVAGGDKNYLEYLDCGHMIMKNINHIK